MGVDLSKTLPALLKAKGMTQEQLADKTGIRRTDINKLANGQPKSGAGPARLRRIADALGVSIYELGAPPPMLREFTEQLREPGALEDQDVREAMAVTEADLRSLADAIHQLLEATREA